MTGPAATPGDRDRGRELAERDGERRWDIGNALGWELEDESPSWAEIMRGIADLRALAAPAETEAAGDAPEDAFRDAVVDLLRRVGRMRDDWAESDKVQQTSLWRSVHTAAEHVGAILDAEHAQPWAEELARLDTAAAPPAQGPAETEAGDVPPLWWSPTRGVIQADEDAYSTVRSAGWTLVAHLPDDAVRLAASPPAPEGEAGSGDGASLIAAERRRQVDREGWTPEHDQRHGPHRITGVGALVYAAATYALRVRAWWPWRDSRPKLAVSPNAAERTRELAKAGALIAAEIDRLNGTAPAGPQAEGAGDPYGLDPYGTGDGSYPEKHAEGADGRAVSP